MPNIPFFGSDDDDEEPAYEQEKGDVRVTSTRSNPKVNVVDLDDDPPASVGGVRVHTISPADGETQPDEPLESTRSGGSKTSTPQSPSPSGKPSDTPTEPTQAPTTPSSPSPHSRGTFALPTERDFLQKLEARGMNGHRPTVETVYVVTGPTYTQPTDLFRLDNDTYYSSATRSSVKFDPHSMAREVASRFPDGNHPKLIARFHTHPSGSTTPSSQDKQSASVIRDSFVEAFETEDFEFFHGIHGFSEHGEQPNSSERQRPSESNGTVSWKGERCQHNLAVYGRHFNQQKKIVIQSPDGD